MDNAETKLLKRLAQHQSQATRIADKMTDLIATNGTLSYLIARELGISDERIQQLLEKAKTETDRLNLMLRDDLSDAA